jgi:hypothetical protein
VHDKHPNDQANVGKAGKHITNTQRLSNRMNIASWMKDYSVILEMYNSKAKDNIFLIAHVCSLTPSSGSPAKEYF